MSKQALTLRYQGRVNNKASLERLRTVLEQLGELYDACITQYRLAETRDPDLFGKNLQDNQLTQARADIPGLKDLHRRVQMETIKRAAKAWDRYARPKPGTEKAGRPRFKSGRYRTLGMENPPGQAISLTRKGRPVLRIKGLPAVRLAGHRAPPADRQPVRITITLKGRRILVRLSYNETVPERKDPRKAGKALGIDLGIALTVSTSAGLDYTSPGERKLHMQIKNAQRKLQRITAAAIARRLAGVRATVDGNNRQLLTKRGRPRTEIAWAHGTPPKSYLKARRLLSDLHERRANRRRDFRHRATSGAINLAVSEEYDLIAVEDLQVASMTRTARGTAENPGRNVRAKTGLNRSILQEGWGEILDMLEYKAGRAGIPTVRVKAAGTSVTCSRCGHGDRKSRRSQELFICTSCGHTDNADHNASVNIGDRGRLYFQKSIGTHPRRA